MRSNPGSPRHDYRWVVALCFAFFCQSHIAFARQPDGSAKTAPAEKASQHLPVHPGKIPALALLPHKPLDARQISHIKECIALLAEIDSPDYGLSSTMSGAAFLPLGQRSTNMLLLTDHRLKSSRALKTLVEIGPDALPFLLAALDDKTPTKLKIDHESSSGAMWFADELWGNPVNPAEVRVLGTRRTANELETPIHSYTAKVGDICMVAIGQIAARPYQAIRYQPTACIVINSPTENAALCEKVRRIWSSRDAGQRLFDSLLLDYATEGNYKKGDSFDEWSVGSDFQVGAISRLLYYFPKETVPLVERRLRGLRVESTKLPGSAADADKELQVWAQREVANGAHTVDLLQAVSWCREPPVRQAVHAVFERAGSADILIAALPAIDEGEDELIARRLSFFLKDLPANERGAYGDGYNLLVAGLQRLHAAAKPLFVGYLQGNAPMRRYTVCEALKVKNPDWSLEVLLPMLEDKRPLDIYTHAVAKDNCDRRLPFRVCDGAAETLNRQYSELKFDMRGTEEELDLQIQAIRKQAARLKR
jgi:hypothetical protein